MLQSVPRLDAITSIFVNLLFQLLKQMLLQWFVGTPSGKPWHELLGCGP
ncbi:hypothetical protein SynMVIR181_02618 [Synechococcus sp. MVIR-18-1]|nr:hypothetical protein SynMVIR181_02618 [Synechococcus sp. MVIR-18-1]